LSATLPLIFEDLASYRLLLARIQRLPQAERAAAAAALSKARNQWVAEFVDGWIVRALSAEGKKALAVALEWFWFNHFNVFWRKGLVGAALPDYVEGALRPEVSGRFGAMLLAVLTHPAMLVYLDNTSNVAGKLNENLARELLELHTLGVAGGYGQADVQAVARLLTGLGLKPFGQIRWSAPLSEQMREAGEFLFDPRRHDFAVKQVMGKAFAGTGFAEVVALVDWMTAQPATARHIAGKLCVFVWGDDPPVAMRHAVAQAFERSGGDLSVVMAAALAFVRQADLGRAADAGGVASFKTPMQWVFSAMHFLGGGSTLRRPQPVRRWLTQLGQPLFERSTPDGYSLRGADWLSSGQLAQRFFVAREMVDRLPAMWGQNAATQALSEARLGAAMVNFSAFSRAAIERAAEPTERVALFLCSPEFMFRQPGELVL
jgi:uncharacterized protein (DUF1800 family)